VKRAAAALVLVLCACTPGRDEPERRDLVECGVRFAAPSGFEPLEPFEEEYPDRIGLRLGFRDDRRREFHVFAGIPGEFGEGLRDAGTLELTEGRTATLLGREEVWVAIWEEGGVCDPRAVLGNGFSRAGFVRALVDAGLAPGA
jgi:hypothetical protein